MVDGAHKYIPFRIGNGSKPVLPSTVHQDAMTFRVTFLGTSGAVPTTARNPSSIHVNRDGDRFLFDVGEGTQRQMMRFGTGFGISHVFVTHIHADHVLGLPGLLLTMGFNDRTEPLTIVTPTGTGENLRKLLVALDKQPGFPVHIEEVEPGVTVLSRSEYDVRTFRTSHRTNSLGYAIVEHDRPGRFDRAAAEELGVPVGPKFSALHEGKSVELADGTVVEPEAVVGAPRPGRRVVYTGDTRPTDATVDAATDADLLIHDGTFGSDNRDRAVETGHATAAEAGDIAHHAGAKHLVLTHISSRYTGSADRLRDEAAERFDGPVRVAADGERIEVPYPE